MTANFGLRWHAQSLTSLQRLIVICQIQFSNSMRVGLAPFAPTKGVRIRSRALREVGFSFCPSPRARGLPRSRPQYEGHGAPRGAPVYRFASGIACEAMVFRKRIALRRSIAAILGEGTVLPGADGGGYSTPDPDGFRRLHPLRVQPANGRAT